MPTLIYIADPMCSWCYGFGPELSAVLNGLPEMKLEVVVGGLRAHNTAVMDETLKATLLAHWRHVEEATGLPFSNDALAHEGFVYNTEPACRAVVAARLFAPSTPLPVFNAIQNAFYARALDVTRGDVLARVASTALAEAGIVIDPARFQEVWASPEAITATLADFAQTQRWGVTGFPTLVLERGASLDLVTSGFIRTEALVERMQAIIDETPG